MTTSRLTTVAFIGLGNMGGPMAVNLAKAGFVVRGFDLSPVLAKAASESGIASVASSTEAAEGADIIITMLPAGAPVLEVWAAIIPVARKDALLIDCSTIDIESCRSAHKIAEAAGLQSLDAPVSGGTGGAKAGTLTFMCGGADEAFAWAKPVLEKMGGKIVHCGAAGAGQAAKICNNMILGATMAVTAEAFVLAERLGLAPQALFDVASTSSGQSWSLTTYCPVPGPVPTSPANHDYKPGFAAALMLKDMRLAMAAAKSAGVTTAVGEEAAKLYADFAAAGNEGVDFSGVINFLRKGKM